MKIYNWNILSQTEREQILARPILGDKENIIAKTQDSAIIFRFIK